MLPVARRLLSFFLKKKKQNQNQSYLEKLIQWLKHTQKTVEHVAEMFSLPELAWKINLIFP